MMEDVVDVERWRPVPGYENRYLVSDRGSVRSLINGNGTRWRNGPRLVRPSVKAYGARYVSLYRNGRGWSVSVHRLVLLAFVGPCPPGMETCHNNGDASDNRLSNLRWDTHQANIDDKRRHRRNPSGSKHPHAILDETDVTRMRELRKAGLTLKELAKLFGTTKTNVSAITRYKRWKHVA